ncbi:HTTM domain-containing protein [Myxococcota bacterium]|nr:HTTM domain-containing protein [Myxococcota bacterium]
MSWTKTLARSFALDPRSVALGRALLAAVVLVDLGYRASQLSIFYTDDGVLPRSAFTYDAFDFAWSLHGWSGSFAWAAALFTLNAAAAIALGLGWRARGAAAICWLLATSLHARNPLLRDGQDDFLRIALFFAALVPLEGAWALGRRRSSAPGPQDRSDAGGQPGPQDGSVTEAITPVASIATAALLLQLGLVYVVGVLTKLRSPWWSDGNAVLYSLSLGRYQTVFAQHLVEHPDLCRVLTVLVLVAEAVLPVLVLVPSRRAWVRTLGVFGFITLHLSFGAFLELGVFPYLAAAVWVMVLPSELWDRGATRPIAIEPMRSPTSVIAAAALALVVLLNVPVVWPRVTLPRPVAELGVALGLQQYWGVFAPRPVTPLSMSDGWWRVVGRTASGAEVDVERGGPVSFERPARIAAELRDHRWRHYLANLRVTWPEGSEARRTIDASRRAWAELLCADWSARRDDPLVSLDLVYLNQPILTRRADAKKNVLLTHRCAR